jgi:hypothetical protein
MVHEWDSQGVWFFFGLNRTKQSSETRSRPQWHLDLDEEEGPPTAAGRE